VGGGMKTKINLLFLLSYGVLATTSPFCAIAAPLQNIKIDILEKITFVAAPYIFSKQVNFAKSLVFEGEFLYLQLVNPYPEYFLREPKAIILKQTRVDQSGRAFYKGLEDGSGTENSIKNISVTVDGLLLRNGIINLNMVRNVGGPMTTYFIGKTSQTDYSARISYVGKAFKFVELNHKNCNQALSPPLAFQ
jgi:hypothetical protein